jgi:ribosomal protein S5
VTKLEQVYLYSLPVKEYQIIDQFVSGLKDEVLKIMPVQKQTRAGQRTRFKAFVVVGDFNGKLSHNITPRCISFKTNSPISSRPRRSRCEVL